MQLSKFSQLVLGALPLLVATSVHAKSLDKDLISLNAPIQAVEQHTVHFSQAISPNLQLATDKQGYETQSDEYWFEVTGKELNEGIALDISQPGALIRLSGKNSPDDILLNDGTIDPMDIELYQGKNKLSSPFKQTVSQQQLATANIFPNSSAVKLDKAMGKGQFQLRVKSKLSSNQRYIINVKEKNSPHKLQLSTERMSYISGEQVHLEAKFKHSDGLIPGARHQAFIKMPSGEKHPVILAETDSGYRVNVPESMEEQRPGLLYELHLESQVSDKGLHIRRNAKFAFALAQPTAKMAQEISVNPDNAKVSLTIASEGRYEISGLVYGTNKEGKSQPFMLSRSAYYLPAGDHQVALEFDKSIMASAGLAAPYKVKNIRLMDQSRMALLQEIK